jgi:hypothetical protein
MSQQTRSDGGQRGSSMVFALLILFSILALAVAGLSAAASGLTQSNNYRTGIQALQAAESGLVHAIGIMNQGGGINGFGNAAAHTKAYDWPNYSGWGSPTFSLPGSTGVGYTITTAGDPYRDAGPLWPQSNKKMLLTAVGQAPGESQRSLRAYLALVGPFTCGAIDLPNTPISPTFNGNSFLVDGNDYDPTTGTTIPGATPTLGISTRTQTDTSNIREELGTSNADNVLGTVVGENQPSVGNCNGPSVSRVSDEIVPNILNQPCASDNPSCVATNPSLNGNDTFGTMDSPQVTHFTGNLTIPQHGTMQGAGVLIVDGGLTINGDVDFVGLIIVRGTTQFYTDVSGHAQIFGALWTTNLDLTVAGNAGIYYSSQALSLVNNFRGSTDELLPQHVTVVAWEQQ